MRDAMRERRSAARRQRRAIAGGGGADKVPVVRVPRFRDSATAFAVARRFRFASRGVARGGARGRRTVRLGGRARRGRSPPPPLTATSASRRGTGAGRGGRRGGRRAADGSARSPHAGRSRARSRGEGRWVADQATLRTLVAGPVRGRAPTDSTVYVRRFTIGR